MRIEDLKKSDKVFIMVNEHKKLCTVERVTKIYIYANGIRFNRKMGWATGPNDGSIRPATEKDIIRLSNSAAKQ